MRGGSISSLVRSHLQYLFRPPDQWLTESIIQAGELLREHWNGDSWGERDAHLCSGGVHRGWFWGHTTGKHGLKISVYHGARGGYNDRQN